MPQPWNEIRDRSAAFSREWAEAESERAESQSFWNAFFHVFAQAADYFEGLAERDLPRYILVSDFKRFRLHDLEKDQQWKFALKDLSKTRKTKSR